VSVTSEFDLCSIPPVLTGTGKLYIVEDDGATLVDCGNFSLVDLIGEAESKRYFESSDEVASVLGITGVVRLQLTGDSFSPSNLSRLLNEPLATAAEGDQIGFRTVRALPIYHLKFRKNYPISEGCDSPCTIDVDIWRCHLDPNFIYTFSQDEPTVHVFNFIALPDAIDHPNNPFALVTMTCPMGGGEGFATGGDGGGIDPDSG
jgi:hypothetical protein